MRQKLEFLAEDADPAAVPTDAELAAHLAAHAEGYRRASQLTSIRRSGSRCRTRRADSSPRCARGPARWTSRRSAIASSSSRATSTRARATS
jgi:hypothetical protein